MPTPLLLCAMEFESSIAKRRLGDRCEIRTIGVGAHCVDALRDLPETFPAGSTAILCGLAGGLTTRAKLGVAYVASRVTDRHTSAIPAPWIPRCASIPASAVGQSEPDRLVDQSRALGLYCAENFLPDPKTKSEAAGTFASDMVDMESAHFARVAQRAGWRWLIVRGVSDDLQTKLPPGVINFVSPSGAPRPMAIALHLALHPWHIPRLKRLERSSTLAMNNACDLVERALLEPQT